MAVQLTLDKKEYLLGDTVRATVTVTNDGAAAVSVPKPELCMPSVSFRLLRNPDAATPESIVTRLGPEAGTVKLEPGKSVSGLIEFPAIEAHGLMIEALYNPRGRAHPHFVNTQVETSNRVAFHVKSGGKKLRAKFSTEAGEFAAEFYPERAHNHVLSFVQLAQKGYFNGIKFHRVVPSFVIQGGDPTGTGSGGPGYRMPSEFNEILHEPGVLSMARTSDPHSAGSQFFVCTARTPHLDNQYTVFGRVVSGLDAVMKIGASADNAGRFSMKKVELVLE
ncbi:MAG: peptidylprolyl isomerase [Planctomycetes bacterium]|nr:peptidylprolyl isomerase [Planctomycetota bacterium]